MAGDEIAQVCQLEFESVKMAVKGSVEVAQWMLRAIHALCQFGSEKWEKHVHERNDTKLHAAGKHSFSDIMKLCSEQGGGMMQTIMIPESMLDQMTDLFQKNGIRYCKVIDFNPLDGKQPISFPPADAVLASKMVSAMMEDKLAQDSSLLGTYNDQIAEINEKLRTVDSPEEREALSQLRENLEQAREEKKQSMSEMGDALEHGCLSSFQDYLRSSKGTEFEKDPEKAVEKLNEGVECGKDFPASECLQPVRDPELMPNEKIRYILPDTGVVITREFHLDQETQLAYSDYSLTTKNGEHHTFTDHQISKDYWNAKRLPVLLDKAGIIETTKCKVFHSEDRLHAYMNSPDSVQKASEKKPNFSSADASAEITRAVSENRKGSASAAAGGRGIEIRVDPQMIMRQGGRISLRLENGETFLFSEIENEKIDEGQAVFELKQDAKILHVKDQEETGLGSEQISAKDMLNYISGKEHSDASVRTNANSKQGGSR